MFTFLLVLLNVLIELAWSQSFPSDLNSCGVSPSHLTCSEYLASDRSQIGCITRQLATTNSLISCDPGNASCYCNQRNFGFAIRDCGFEAPPPRPLQSAQAQSLGHRLHLASQNPRLQQQHRRRIKGPAEVFRRVPKSESALECRSESLSSLVFQLRISSVGGGLLHEKYHMARSWE